MASVGSVGSSLAMQLKLKVRQLDTGNWFHMTATRPDDNDSRCWLPLTALVCRMSKTWCGARLLGEQSARLAGEPQTRISWAGDVVMRAFIDMDALAHTHTDHKWEKGACEMRCSWWWCCCCCCCGAVRCLCGSINMPADALGVTESGGDAVKVNAVNYTICARRWTWRAAAQRAGAR